LKKSRGNSKKDKNYPKSENDLDTPCFIVDIEKTKKNCEKMREIAKNAGCDLRPHMKTHKTLEIGHIMAPNKKKILVSTLAEAEFFADGGFDDILYAIPVTKSKIERLSALNQAIDIKLLVNDKSVLSDLATTKLRWKILIEVSTGYERTGLDTVEKIEEIKEIAKILASNEKAFDFIGLYCHCGDTYNIANPGQTKIPGKISEIQRLNKNGVEKLITLKKGIEKIKINNKNIECKVVGTGSTPGCSNPVEEFKNLTEIHPGNYCFYDYFQVSIGSCQQNEVSCYVLSRVISVFKNYIVIDAGFTAISKDSPQLNFGHVIAPDEDLFISGMSQEAGKLKYSTKTEDMTKNFKIGDFVKILPAHSCHTAAFHPKYFIKEKTEENLISHFVEPCRGW